MSQGCVRSGGGKGGKGKPTVLVADVLIEVNLSVNVVAGAIIQPGPEYVAVVNTGFLGAEVESHGVGWSGYLVGLRLVRVVLVSER